MAFFKEKNDEKLYRYYVADALKIVTHNTALASGGTELTTRLSEILTHDTNQPQEKTEEEIIDNLKRKLRGLA